MFRTYRGFSHSVMGASHEKRGTVCQDSSDFRVHDGWCIAAAADGHGSKKHFRSDRGSSFAVKAAIDTIEDFFGAAKDEKEFESIFTDRHDRIIKNIEKQIIYRWNGQVSRHLEENPVTDTERSEFTEEEFEGIACESYYGTTLIAIVTCDSFSFGIQIGDGTAVAVYNDGRTAIPIGYEESAPANVTASICNRNAIAMFNSFYSEEKMIALFASTDGLYTSFGSEYDFLDYHTIIASQLADMETFETTIVKNLYKRSHYGTEDDISLSCIFDDELIRNRHEFLLEKVDDNRARAESRKAEQIANQAKQRLRERIRRNAESAAAAAEGAD
ncbi:MAG: protein phosphatase 2C domain-containing protein [Ruminococcus sp.]|nr:protein phosphatase 2C domain-containing protein [Ruminococcus sp.]